MIARTTGRRSCVRAAALLVRMTLVLLVAAALLVTTALPRTAWAETQRVDSATRGAARTLGYEGVQAYEAGDFTTALDRLDRAYQVLRVPSLALWSGRALERLGRWVEASERYLEATRLPLADGSDRAVQERSQEDARRAEAALRPKIPAIVIEVKGPVPRDLEVTKDGAPVNRALLSSRIPTDPGSVLVVGTAGERQLEVRAEAVEGKTTVVSLDFSAQAADSAGTAVVASSASASPAAAPSESKAGKKPGSTQRLLGWIAIGTGGAALVLGGVTGGLALAEQTRLTQEQGCQSSGACPPGTELGSVNTMRLLSTVGLIAGGVLVGTGATLLLTAPKQTAVTARLGFDLGAVRVEGTF